MSAVASISSQVRSGSWAAGAPGYSASQADCASIPGIAGMLMQYIAPLREWFDDLLGDPGTVGGFASRWEGAESSLRRVVETLRDAEPRLAELDGRTVRALRARYGDLLSVAEDAAQWTGATASAVRLVSQIIESTRVLICDFLGRLSRFADDLFRFSLNPLQKLEDIQRFAESAAGFVTTAGALVKSLTGAVVSLAQLLYKLVPLVGDALATLRDVLADMLPLVGGLTGGPLGLVFGNVLHDFLTGDARVREIDPSTLNEDQLAAWNDAHEVTSLDSLSDLVSVNGTTDAMGGESSTAIDIKEVVGPDGSTHWVVSLPSTQAWEFGPSSGAMNDRDNNLALMLDNPLFRTQYERAVLDAMQQAGIPAGSDVVLTGFSQGGIMAANLAADSSFPYNPIGVVTNGSPVDNFHVPPNVPVYAFQHATDVVPMLDGSLVGVPGLPGQSPFDIPNSPVTVLPPNTRSRSRTRMGHTGSEHTTTRSMRRPWQSGKPPIAMPTAERILGTSPVSAAQWSITRYTKEWNADMSITGRARATRGAVALALAAMMLALSGCGPLLKETSDGDFAETIPAALMDSEIGVTDAYAAKTISGFTFYLSVGVDLDHEDASADDLAGILRIVLEHNDVPSDEIDLGVDGSDGESIDLEALVRSISPDLEIASSTYGDIQVTNDQAAAIVEAVWGE